MTTITTTYMRRLRKNAVMPFVALAITVPAILGVHALALQFGMDWNLWAITGVVAVGYLLLDRFALNRRSRKTWRSWARNSKVAFALCIKLVSAGMFSLDVLLPQLLSAVFGS